MTAPETPRPTAQGEGVAGGVLTVLGRLADYDDLHAIAEQVVGAIPVDPVAGPDGAPTDTDAIVALSPDEARHIAALLRRGYPLDAAPDDQECQRFDALADRIEGAIPVGAS